jgi:hypothetical protein
MVTGVEISGLGEGWEKTEKDHEMFCNRIFRIPRTTANGGCVRELGRTKRREKVVERIIKYRKRLWGNRFKKAEQDLHRLGMGDI